MRITTGESNTTLYVNRENRFFPVQLRGLTLVLIGLLTTLIVFGVAWVLALYYTRPLRRLDQAMERFSLGELKTRVVVPDGIARRARRSIDAMLTIG